MEMTSEMVWDPSFGATQGRLQLRKQGSSNPWQYCFFASDAPSVIQEVADGTVQFAMLNPAGPLAMAVRGTGPFKEPLPLSVIATIPSHDEFAFAVHPRTGITSLAQIRERRYPLKISMRAYEDHADYLVVEEVFRALGFSTGDLESWGGKIVKRPSLGFTPDALAAGEIDAFFEEAIKLWLPKALDAGMAVLPVEEPVLASLEMLGLPRATISKFEYPRLEADVPTVDFSGWPIFTRSDTPDDLVHRFCAALEARKDRIPSDTGWSLPLEEMCVDSADAPLAAALHPAAEAYWREHGYLK